MPHTSNQHIFICKGFSTFSSEPSFDNPEKTWRDVSLGWTCLKCFYLANLVENIPLRIFLYGKIFLFFINSSAHIFLSTKWGNKGVLFNSAQQTLIIVWFFKINDFSSSVKMCVQIRLKHDISSSFSSEQPMALNNFSLAEKFPFLILQIATPKIDNSLAWVKRLLMLKDSSLKSGINILFFKLKSLISSCPV